jgi:hypothetical protein
LCKVKEEEVEVEELRLKRKVYEELLESGEDRR